VNVAWKSVEEHAVFFRHQFDAQALHFEGSYDSLDYDIIEFDRTPIGRLVLSWEPDHLHCVDIILMPQYRRGGLGSAIMKAITDEADRRAISASLFYEKWKPYLGPFYAKYGFSVVKEYDAHYYMERRARSV
jgi:GNAT superfamily N-acetyltransferase